MEIDIPNENQNLNPNQVIVPFIPPAPPAPPVLLREVYHGKLHNDRNRNRYRVGFLKPDGKYQHKYFNYHAYGGVEDAHQVALEYKRQQSDARGLTQRYYETTLPAKTKQYYGGTFDGDGSLVVQENGQLTLKYGQASGCGRPQIIYDMVRDYNGRFTQQKDKRRPDGRPMYNAVVSDSKAVPMLYDLAQNCILHDDSATVCFESIITFDQATVPELYEYVKWRHSMAFYQSVTIKLERITEPYIAGFFDAEGNVQPDDYKNHMRVRFYQKKSVPLLEAINHVLGNTGKICYENGSREVDCLCFTNEAGVEVLQKMLPYLRTKRYQAELGIEFFDLMRQKPQTPAIRQRMDFIRVRCGAEKHK